MQESIMNSLAQSAQERAIAEKVYAGERISDEEGLYLFEEAPLGFTASLANFVREQKQGNKTFFNRNFHIEPTNVCIYTCAFCSYSRLIKNREDGWEYTMEDMLNMVKAYDDPPIPG